MRAPCSRPYSTSRMIKLNLKGRDTAIDVDADRPLGLSSDSRHPVQKAWIELDVPQCGYCQSGQSMSAAALLACTPQPSDADIDAAMSGNICRGGAYQRIRAAIHRAATLKAGA
jgi:xanthine dehydrogenase iron-sulfur cluster and FAD-binding subunit A